jgi:hypothetical protein
MVSSRRSMAKSNKRNYETRFKKGLCVKCGGDKQKNRQDKTMCIACQVYHVCSNNIRYLKKRIKELERRLDAKEVET